MPVIKFIKEKKEITVPAGANLRDEARKAGINLNQGVNGIGASINRFVNCMGKGMCGTCRVNINKGRENVNPLSMMEHIRFKTPVLAFPDPLPNLA